MIEQLLYRDGIAIWPTRFPVSDFVKYLSHCPVYDNHVRQDKPAAEEGLGSHPWMCHYMHDVILAPDWFEVVLAFTPLAAKYLGSNLLLYSLNAFYTEPDATPKPDIQGWHRDSDDTKFLALFMYGTDVLNDNDGPHQYEIGSHNTNNPFPVGPITTIYGKAGTMFFSISKGLHQGLVPKTRRRMLCWARWGVSDPPEAYKWDKLSPLPKELLGNRYPKDAKLQQIIKLVVS